MRKRTPPALRQLVAQIVAHGNEEPEIVGDPDGLGVYRSIKVKAATAKWLVPALEVIKDRRIASVEKKKVGRSNQVVITFVASHFADRVDPFPIEDVDSILRA